MKCRRPSCGNDGQRNLRGWCLKHHRAQMRQDGRDIGYAHAEPVREHLLTLQRAGLSYRCIGRCADVSLRTVLLVAQGKREKIWAHTAQKLMSVTAADVRNGALVPAIGTIRRLRALHAIGYTAAQLAKLSGCANKPVRDLLLGGQSTVRQSTATRVASMFDELQLKPLAPSRTTSRAINRARKLGWATPLQWDEDRVDDPAARPSCGQEIADGWWDEYQKLKARGYTQKKIAVLMGINADSVRARVRRLEAA